MRHFVGNGYGYGYAVVVSTLFHSELYDATSTHPSNSIDGCHFQTLLYKETPMTDDKTLFSTAHRKHLSNAMKGKAKSQAHKAKIAETMRRKAAERLAKKESKDA